jgi:RNA polymerase sigma-70 factor (ECF subfamily)
VRCSSDAFGLDHRDQKICGVIRAAHQWRTTRVFTSLAATEGRGSARAGLRPLGNVRPVADHDDALVARLAAGDDDALGELFDRYAGFVLGLSRRVTRSNVIAEEVVQDVFASVWTNPQRFDSSRGSMRAYLGVLAYRRSVDAVRRDTCRRAREERCIGADLDAASTPDQTDATSVREVVRQAIACLPDDQRLAVELAFWEGHTHREVAIVLGIPEGTAKSRLRLAQAKLGILLAPLRGEHV